jgi:hypothetical protein
MMMRQDEQPSQPTRRMSLDKDDLHDATAEAMLYCEDGDNYDEDSADLLMNNHDINIQKSVNSMGSDDEDTDCSTAVDNDIEGRSQCHSNEESSSAFTLPQRATPSNTGSCQGRRGTRKATYLASIESKYQANQSRTTDIVRSFSCLPSSSSSSTATNTLNSLDDHDGIKAPAIVRRARSCPKMMNTGGKDLAPLESCQDGNSDESGSSSSLRLSFSKSKYSTYKAKSCRDLCAPLPTIDEYSPFYRRSCSTGMMTSADLRRAIRVKESLKNQMYHRRPSVRMANHTTTSPPKRAAPLNRAWVVEDVDSSIRNRNTLPSSLSAEDRKNMRTLVKNSLIKASIDDALSLIVGGRDSNRDPNNTVSSNGNATRTSYNNNSQVPSSSLSVEESKGSQQNATFDLTPPLSFSSSSSSSYRQRLHHNLVVTVDDNEHHHDQISPAKVRVSSSSPSNSIAMIHPFELLVRHDQSRKFYRNTNNSSSFDDDNNNNNKKCSGYEMLRGGGGEQPPKPPCRKLSPSHLYRQTLALKLVKPTRTPTSESTSSSTTISSETASPTKPSSSKRLTRKSSVINSTTTVAA